MIGHAQKDHWEHYRIPVVARDIGRVSQLLEIGLGKSPRKQNIFFKMLTIRFLFLVISWYIYVSIILHESFVSINMQKIWHFIISNIVLYSCIQLP